MTDHRDGQTEAPPSAPWAEAALLGGCLIGPIQVARLASRLKSDDFYRERHGLIWQAMAAIAASGGLPHFSAVVAALDSSERLSAVGGPAYVAGLIAECPNASEIFTESYADAILDASRKRRLIRTASVIAQTAWEAGVDSDSAIRSAMLAIGDVAKQAGVSEAMGPFDLAIRAQGLIDERTGAGDERALSFGLRDLDRLTAGGARPGQLIIVGGRPGMGKSAALRQFARSFAHRGRVLFASNEMTMDQLAERDLASYSGVSLPDILRGRYSPDQMAALYDALGRMGECEITNYVDGAMTTGALRALAVEMHVRQPLIAVVADYLQRFADDGERALDRVGRAVNNLKALALELDVPVIVGSQLNRGSENEGDRRPSLTNLRETGAIEQDADIVLLLHRDGYYFADEASWRRAQGRHANGTFRPNVAEIIIAKQRQGVQATVETLWIGALATFRDLAKEGNSDA